MCPSHAEGFGSSIGPEAAHETAATATAAGPPCSEAGNAGGPRARRPGAGRDTQQKRLCEPCRSRTTMMLRNIPNKYTQSALLEEIEGMGFGGTYDFFYLPMDFHSRSNVGYAFINFTSHEHAKRFCAAFAEHRFLKYPSRKVSNVSVAHVQGVDANLKHFENRAVTHARTDEYRPVVLRGAQRGEVEGSVAAAAVDATPAMLKHMVRRDLEEALCAYLASRGSAVAQATAEPPAWQGEPLVERSSADDRAVLDGDVEAEIDAFGAAPDCGDRSYVLPTILTSSRGAARAGLNGVLTKPLGGAARPVVQPWF